MSSRNLGQLTIDLVAKIGGWTDGLSKAERELDSRTKRMNKMANDFGRGIGSALKGAAAGFIAFAGVAVSFDAVATGIKNAIDRADQLRDASIRLGIGVETLSAYGYAAQQTGTDIEELNKGLLRLSRNAQEALDPKSRQGQLFKALGIDRDSLSDLDRLVPQIADKFAQLQDGAQKAALAQELFGRSGANLIEFLNQGGDGIREFADRARELGIIIDDETAAAADDFNDQLADLKAAGTGLATQVAAELLPQLTDLVEWASDFVSDGDNAREIADDIADAMRGLADAIELVVRVGSGLSSLRENLAGAENWWRDLVGDFGANGVVSSTLKRAIPWAYEPLIGGPAPLPDAGAIPVTRLPAVSVTGKAPGKSDLELSLEKFFGTGGRASTGSRKSELTEQQKEAERLKETYDRLNESLAQQIALFGQDGEAAKLRYQLEHGELSKLTSVQKENLLAQAQKLDQMELEKELADAAEKRVKEDIESQERQHESIQAMLADMEVELEMLGKTREQQEILNNLRWAGVDANSAYGESIIQATQELSRQREMVDDQISAMDGLRDSARGFLGDLRDGVGIWDSLKNAALDFADVLFDIASRRLVEQIFGQYGSTSTGTSGGWMDALFGLFSGQSSGFGFADGGFTGYGGKYEPAGIVHKGEYVMPMDAVSRIGVANLDRIARGGSVGGVNQNFYTLGLETRETSERKAQLAGREARRALARTGR
jgi:hypothetical protein